ncbi:unnamed protein product, partial [Prunus brigantina]
LGVGEEVSQSRSRHRRCRPERPSLRAEDDDRRPPARSRTNTRRQVAEESSQAQSPNLPHGQGAQGDRPLGTDPRKKLARSTEDALCKEIDRVDCSPFTDEVERAPPPKRFTTPSITPFKGDSDPESHLRHFKSAMILYKADDALMCKVFAMTLRGAAQDWFHTLPSMGFEPKISKLARSFTGFNGATSITVGTIDLDVHSPPVVCSQTFMVIDEVSPYNGILGRPWISKIEAVTSALHQKIRYPILGGGIGQINSDQAMARRCTAQGLKKSKQLQFTPDQDEGIRPEDSPEKGWKPEDDVEFLVPPDPDQPDKEAQIGSRQNPNKKDRDEGIRPEGSLEEGWKPEKDVELVSLDPDQPDKKARIGLRLCPDEKMELTIFLQNNKDIRNFAPERAAIIEAKIDKLLAAGFIEGLVDSTSGNQLLSFIDAYSGYNKIMMYDDDKAKTSFIIERGTYCYKVMPFGLKNAGATYQRLVNKTFKEQIGRTMEVYVDDMLVKAPKRADHLKNLTEAFSLLRQYRMKLNPSKCTFGVSSGRFLGYLVTQRGIKAHPCQIKAILEMKSPSTVKEIQSLTGRAAALNRFLSKSTDKCRPFFKALKKGQKDKWDEECEVAFQNLKTYLTSPPLLSKPVPGEDLFVYLSVSNSAVSLALIREELGAQHPIFYTSKALLDAETNYPKLEKLILALVVSARKLRPYYQAHRVIVMTDFPLRSILHSPDASQRLMKWAIELSQYDLLYRPKTAIKAQALADFVAEFTPSAEEEKLDSKKKESSRADKTSTEPDQPRDMWQLCVDGALNQKGAGAGVVIITPDGTLLEQAIRLGFPTSNNEAEYEALLAGLRLAKELSIKKLAIYSDSQLITSQTSGEYMAKHPRMILYLDK